MPMAYLFPWLSSPLTNTTGALSVFVATISTVGDDNRDPKLWPLCLKRWGLRKTVTVFPTAPYDCGQLFRGSAHYHCSARIVQEQIKASCVRLGFVSYVFLVL